LTIADQRLDAIIEGGFGKLADADIDHMPACVQENRGGQTIALNTLCKFTFSVDQNVVQIEVFIIKVVTNGFAGLALVGKDEVQVAVLFLAVRKYGHFPPARWAPGGPQIDDSGLAMKL